MSEASKQSSALARWLFIAVRRRDRYSTIVAVPKSEYPDLASARKRVYSEFAHDTWKITKASNQDDDPAKMTSDA